MKKDFLFALAMLLIAILLFLYRLTGLTAHIALSVVGVLVLAAYTVATRKEWKAPALEILMRVFYAIALISGVAVKAISVPAMLVLHKAGAALFAVLLVVLLVKKLVACKKK